jgi:hypothetical protein
VGPCAKTTVRCTIVAPNGERFVGENICHTPQAVCPRVAGEDYAKCATVCHQVGHAEAVAAYLGRGRSEGGTAYLEGHTYACASATRRRKPSSASTGPGFRSMTMFAHLPPIDSTQTDFARMLSVEDSPVRMSVLRAVERVLRRTKRAVAEYARLVGELRPARHRGERRSSAWTGAGAEFSETWPRSGMMLNGTAYRLPTLVPDNFGTEFGLWPTPNATAFKGGDSHPGVVSANPERNNWQDWCSLVLGQRYPVPETAEQVMGYPEGYTEISNSETP